MCGEGAAVDWGVGVLARGDVLMLDGIVQCSCTWYWRNESVENDEVEMMRWHLEIRLGNS